jgi:pyruvate/2-oxoglutarate dehydrogenase complex dihydrolipoamide dehydrogenase (E3) component
VRNNAVVTAPPSIVILGGGPGGYEAALVAAHLGADVTVIDSDGLGGAAVLTDVVPSKTLIATAEVLATMRASDVLGLTGGDDVAADLGAVNRRVKKLAKAQSEDIRARLEREGVRIVVGRGTLAGPGRVAVEGTSTVFRADAVLVAVGARPRRLPDALPDGERILTWTQVYDLDAMPERLVVVGSGVTGAEFASAYDVLGSDVALVSSRDRVLPGEDADAAQVLEDVFRERGMEVLSRSRAQSVKRTGDGVVVTLSDGRTVEGSHCLMAVGAVPSTAGIGLEQAGVTLGEGGHVKVDRVSRTGVPGVYAAGDCTGVLALASVAAMQGRIAMAHALGDAVAPLKLQNVSSTVFTAPEIATVGITQALVDERDIDAAVVTMPLATNPRAKMQGIREGFVKLFASPHSGRVLGGVVVAPLASELIHPVTIAVTQRLTVDAVAATFTVYPSLTGSIGEAARRLHQKDEIET